MTAIKESSTIQENKRLAIALCPVTYLMEKIGGYWKPIIIYHLFSGEKRYSELKRMIPTITEKVLIQHLKQLQADQLVIREAKTVVPPFVMYKLSSSGMRLMPVIDAMAAWSFEEIKHVI